MKVLGIESATEVCSVGIADDTGLVSDYRLKQGYAHAEKLPEAVNFVLSQAELSLNDLDGIAVSTGPGSFTGLRIGIGLAKGICTGINLPLINVPTLDSLVISVPFFYDYACVLLKSRKKEYYRAIYRQLERSWYLVGGYEVVAEKEIEYSLPSNKSIIFTGQINDNLKSILKNKLDNIEFIDNFTSLPDGFSIASIGIEKLKKGEISSADKLIPIYIKKFLGVS